MSSLRLRLAAAMVVILAAALGISSLLDQVGSLRTVLPVLQSEPYQDGLVLACFGLAVAVLIWVISAWSLAPLSRASVEAAAVGPAHPGRRISAARLPSEMRPLVAAVNAALDRLEAAYETERRFTADAAHELRTPLSVLTLRLQQARAAPDTRSQDWDAIEQDVRDMTRLVTQLLDLARKQAAGGAEPPQPVNLFRMAREAAAAILPLAEAAGRAVILDLPDTSMVQGRADDLRDMIRNLLENALVHGRGAIRLTGHSAGGRSIVEVADDGPGVPEASRLAVFDRFRKAVPSSPGTGLGLAIVREVARSHGGQAAFRSGPACVVRVDLPDITLTRD